MVSGNLRDLVPPVFFHNIAHDFFATAVIKVNINIGHANAVRVQEPLKEQIITNGVHIGNPGAVGHH